MTISDTMVTLFVVFRDGDYGGGNNNDRRLEYELENGLSHPNLIATIVYVRRLTANWSVILNSDIFIKILMEGFSAGLSPSQQVSC